MNNKEFFECVCEVLKTIIDSKRLCGAETELLEHSPTVIGCRIKSCGWICYISASTNDFGGPPRFDFAITLLKEGVEGSSDIHGSLTYDGSEYTVVSQKRIHTLPELYFPCNKIVTDTADHLVDTVKRYMDFQKKHSDSGSEKENV